MQQFQCMTRLIYGPDAIKVLSEVKPGKALIITDSFFMKNGTANRIASGLSACSCEFFSDIRPDPEVRAIAQACGSSRVWEKEILVALGGGSVLDCAKAMALFCETKPMLIAIPTTSGTGSEVTSFSILTHEGVKHPLVDDRLRPDWAILDETLLSTLPSGLIAETGMDLISHAVEAIAAKDASPITNALAIGALRTALQTLKSSYQGDSSVRGELHAAAAMAGLAFDRAGLGLCHALSHALGGQFHVPHGRLNGVLLPSVMQFNCPVALPVYAEAARASGLNYQNDQMAFRSLVQHLKELRRTLKLPQTLQGAGISPEALRESSKALAHTALEDPCMKGNPILPEAGQIMEILEAAAQ